MITGASVAWIVARKEIMEHVRSKRILFIGGFFFLAFLTASILGIALFRGDETDSGLAIRTVLMFYFSAGWVGGFTFTSVLAIALSADAMCGEWKDRSLFLLLSKPVSREAVLTGKVLGAFLSVAMVFIASSLISLIIMIAFLGVPDADSWWKILGGFGIVLAGIIPFVAVGILCSSVFRTPVSSFVVALALWFLVFPLLGNIGAFIEMIRHGTFGEQLVSQLFAHLSPSTLMQYAAQVWTGGELVFGLFGGILDNPGLVLVAMAGHTALYLGLSYWVVKRRDYA